MKVDLIACRDTLDTLNLLGNRDTQTIEKLEKLFNSGIDIHKFYEDYLSKINKEYGCNELIFRALYLEFLIDTNNLSKIGLIYEIYTDDCSNAELSEMLGMLYKHNLSLYKLGLDSIPVHGLGSMANLRIKIQVYMTDNGVEVDHLKIGDGYVSFFGIKYTAFGVVRVDFMKKRIHLLTSNMDMETYIMDYENKKLKLLHTRSRLTR